MLKIKLVSDRRGKILLAGEYIWCVSLDRSVHEVSCQCRVIGSVIALELSFITAPLPHAQREASKEGGRRKVVTILFEETS